MRLEFEPTKTVLPLVGNEIFERSEDLHDLESLLKKGIAAAQNGERDEARKLLSQASAIDPECEDAWMWLASISEYPEELLAFLDRVLSINPENVRAIEWRQATRSLLAKTFVIRAESAWSDGSVDLAEKYVNQALAFDEKCSGAWFLKATMLNSVEEQLELLGRVLEIEPDHEHAKNAIASIHAARSQAAFAEAKTAAIVGNHSKAVEILDAFIEDVPDSVDAWLLKSHLSQSLEQKLEGLKKALEIDPENTAARSGIAFLELTFGSKEEPSEFTEADIQKMDPDPETSEEVTYAQTDDVAPAIEFAADENAKLAEDAQGLEEDLTADSQFYSQPENESIDFGSDAESGYVDQVEYEANTAEAETYEFPPVETASELPQEIIADRSQDEFLGPVEEPTETELQTVEDSLHYAGEVTENDSYPYEQISAVENSYETSEFFEADGPSVEEPSESEFAPELEPASNGNPCPYCSSSNDQQAFNCSTCRATLTLADIDALFTCYSQADREVIQTAVTQMEADWNLRDFNEEELTAIGIGHFNLGNYEAGLKYLSEAVRLDPNNVMLGGQVNAVAIRLEELRRQIEINETKPTGKTILVVDDSPTVRKLISGKLEKSGHIVVCASDGVEALEKLENGLPDLVLLDITMPRMDGYEVCKQIRSNPAAKELPVVMISGKDGFFDKVRGRMAGSTGYVTKPFGPETLMKALETYLLPEA